MAEKKRGRVRWIALGTVLGVVAVWGGFGLVGAATSAPSAITTCTKARNGKTKVIATSDVVKCTAKGKGFAKSWTDASEVKYHNILRGSTVCGGPSDDFTNLNLVNQYVISCLQGGNFTGSNMAGANLFESNFLDTNLTNVNFTGADFVQAFFGGAITTGANVSGVQWDHTQCPDNTYSDTNGTTPQQSCLGHGF